MRETHIYVREREGVGLNSAAWVSPPYGAVDGHLFVGWSCIWVEVQMHVHLNVPIFRLSLDVSHTSCCSASWSLGHCLSISWRRICRFIDYLRCSIIVSTTHFHSLIHILRERRSQFKNMYWIKCPAGMRRQKRFWEVATAGATIDLVIFVLLCSIWDQTHAQA